MTSDSRATFTLRAPRSLLDRLKAMADDRSHSMNTEIIHRLEESVYLSDAAHALEGEELTDLERAVIQRLRDIDESTRQSLLILLNKLDTKTKADR